MSEIDKFTEYERTHLAITCKHERIVPISGDEKGKKLYRYACTKLKKFNYACPCNYHTKRLIMI